MGETISPRVEYSCLGCAFVLWRAAAGLEVATLGLYDDARYPVAACLSSTLTTTSWPTCRTSCGTLWWPTCPRRHGGQGRGWRRSDQLGDPRQRGAARPDAPDP